MKYKSEPENRVDFAYLTIPHSLREFNKRNNAFQNDGTIMILYFIQLLSHFSKTRRKLKREVFLFVGSFFFSSMSMVQFVCVKMFDKSHSIKF